MIGWLRRRSHGGDGHTIPYADPLLSGRHPFQTFLLALCVVSGIPLVFGEPNASSMASLLPGWMATAWGASLSVGAVVALAGGYWPRANYATALTLERVGLLVVGTAAIAYASIILIATAGKTGGFVAASITLAFGLSAVVRSRDIGRVIRRAVAITEGKPMRLPMREDESDD